MKKIKYSKKRLNSTLTMGLLFIAIGVILVILTLVFGEFKNIPLVGLGLGQIVAGISILILYYFENKSQYLTINNGELKKNAIVPKKINLNEVISIKEFAGDYKLKTDKGEFTIDTQIIEPNSLTELDEELKNLNVVWG